MGGIIPALHLEPPSLKLVVKCKLDNDSVKLIGFDKVIQLFSADGVHYQTEAQNEYWNFRDPCPFITPNDGNLYMVFEGNVAGDRDSHIITSNDMAMFRQVFVASAKYQVGYIGFAVAKDNTGNNWEILPSLLTAVGTEAPTVQIKIVGNRTFVVKQFDYGFIPAMKNVVVR